MIVIKQGNAVITINPAANLTDFYLCDFRKLLKIASNKWQNNPEEIRAEMLEMLERERENTEKERERTDVYKPTKKQIERDLKKIEKYRMIVEQLLGRG